MFNNFAYELFEKMKRDDSSIVYREKKISMLRFVEDIRRAMNFLKRYSKIVLSAQNSYNWLVVYFAGVFTGKQLYLIDKNREKDVYNAILSQIAPDIVFENEEGLNEALLVEVDETPFVSNSQIVFYTTGSTGFPKGVVHTLDSILWSVFSMEKTFAFQKSDKYYAVVPFSHVMGHSLVLLSLLFCDSTVISEGDPFPPIDQDITIMALPPTIISMYTRIESKIRYMTKLKLLITGGAPLPKTYHDLLVARGVNLFYGYGSTECITTASTNYKKTYGRLYPLENVEAFLSDNGELLLRTKSAGKKYIGGTSIIDENGVYHTNDCAILYDDGGFEILGRMDTLIVLGSGYKIFPEEVEQKIIKQFDDILDCLLCCQKTDQQERLILKIKVRSSVKMPEDFLSIINQKLNDYEKISKIEIVQDIPMIGNKKKRK